MGKKNSKIKIQEERAKRMANIAKLNAMLLKQIGALEQLDALEGIKPPDPSDNGAPVKEKVSEKKES